VFFVVSFFVRPTEIRILVQSPPAMMKCSNSWDVIFLPGAEQACGEIPGNAVRTLVVRNTQSVLPPIGHASML
jgi:hypothetical protein